MSFQIFVPDRPKDINPNIKVWVIALIGEDLDSFMPHMLGMKYRLVAAQNRYHAQRILKKDIRKLAKFFFNNMNRHVDVRACLAKDY